MDLHSIARPIVNAVNPFQAATLRKSMGMAPTSASGLRIPLYETPGAFTGSIAGTVLTVSAIASGFLRAGQAIAGAGVAAGTLIAAQTSGTPGGVGAYSLAAPAQTVASEAMTSTLSILAQVQPMTWRDLQQVEGLNLQGTRSKLYLAGFLHGVERPTEFGGDLVTIPGGWSAGVYLVAQVLEQFPDWVAVACTLQND